MHMADALISPAVGGTMLVVTAGVAAYSIKKLQNEMDEKKIPLMGVMGAFVFAAQMINFSIPGTGSSGHLGGGMLLAILLGPYAGFLTMASILLIQALFFGDGGLLTYGCNVFNLGFYTCFIAYPLIYKWFIRKGVTSKRILAGSMASALVALQLGAFSVVLETLLSGKTELPFGKFVLLMQPIHLAIGIVEGLVTAAIVTFVLRARPEILEKAANGEALGNISMKKVLTGLSIAVVMVGGLLSWFASANPDGLEWSIEKIAGTTELKAPDGIHKILSEIQSKTAILPDYNFKTNESENKEKTAAQAENTWPAVSAGTSVSGIVGGALTLALAVFTGWIIIVVKRKKRKITT
ncbi:energy-coupling factor ABC transporter permease [Bacillus methanolicus]|uniref:Cobalamin (Vitamin B12) biosynthesis CbiM protein n=1 Tax=Bacillus methanolicus (strain MGA3 / ATCC 53907) TaxID=796606 RepID=I3E345_BACMM|nr:energy-coupling factor ABC transporter permease [Bacillus methanolicus]AIE58988.1 cobalamin (vitamin B12) biosynthesis CbiM protein [Bacillus methanolicus MGA3]EIJ80916.1 cobalamin biosynthesis protein CbiM [Bacillus methanolicus MGA3]UQD51080.1 cobalamin biosynthesis protein CbiM [Bacillus methanolicus]